MRVPDAFGGKVLLMLDTFDDSLTVNKKQQLVLNPLFTLLFQVIDGLRVTFLFKLEFSQIQVVKNVTTDVSTLEDLASKILEGTDLNYLATV